MPLPDVNKSYNKRECPEKMYSLKRKKKLYRL